MDLLQAKRILEGILFVSSEPVAPKRLKAVLPGIDPEALRRLVDELNAEYAQHRHALLIQEVAGGYQLVTDPELAGWIKRTLELPREDSLSKRALETLAIVAYRQPTTKAEIEVIRGVDVGGTLDTLLEHQLIQVTGRKDSPGRPLLYGTTTEFLRHFGLKSLKDLPALPAGSSPSLPGSGSEPAPSAPQDASASNPPSQTVRDCVSSVESANPSQTTEEASTSAARRPEAIPAAFVAEAAAAPSDAPQQEPSGDPRAAA